MQLLFAIAVLFAVVSAESVKRATGCDNTGTIDALCTSASEGAFCLTAAESQVPGGLDVCGCKKDDDCFTSPPFPFCITNTAGGGSCDSCQETAPSFGMADGSAARIADNADHLFCRDRFPSNYLLTTPPGFVATSEGVPPSASGTLYFRELCNRSPTQGGACEGCHQASITNTPDSGPFPTYPTGLPGASYRGPRGSIHCRHVYTGLGGLPSRHICAYDRLFADAGIPGVFQTTTVALNIARNAANPNGPTQTETRPIVDWQGACIPCQLGGIDRHGLCFLADPVRPICSVAGCSKCTTNVQCGSATAPDPLVDGTTTGGANCYLDGHCGDCTSDADCGVLDGGETLAQPTCNVATGICEDPQPCADNIDCPANTNCMKDGTCRACNAGLDCGTNDGGSKQNQPTCQTGVCRDCAANADCVGTAGANCEVGGACANCGASLVSPTICGVGNDGGEIISQTLCNPSTQICETPCDTNLFCSQKGGSDAFTRGANCQADGTCKDCLTAVTCGAADGGTPSGQPSCDVATHLCFNPFSCAVNDDCDLPGNTGLGQNCQTSNQCLNCAVNYASSTCGTLDGGEVTNQVNCDLTSRECVAACSNSNNNQCSGTQGANCMANGVCFDCRNDADCGVGNAWGGDFGNQRVCESTICVDACTSNNDCAGNENCHKDGRCTACTNDADCVTNDGPPPMGTNTICQTGRCVNPYVCVANNQDNSDCASNTGRNNCQADGTCRTCVSNADCGVLDGGQTPGQPRCQGDGTCGPCTVNADCPSAIPNCGADGSCYACTALGETCGAADGGENANQQNCDTVTDICVDYCTADDQCDDDCAPYCNLERGCCVECTSDTHCPLVNWRGTEAGRTECSADSTCIFPFTCESDADCPAGTPACSLAEEECVECLYDSHCSEPLPACSTGEQRCVECTFDSHCAAGDECGSDQTCGNGDNNNFDGASVLSFITASLFVLFATVLRF